MRQILIMFIFTASSLYFSSDLCADEQSGSFISEVEKACSGYIEIHAKGAGGTIKFQNYDISIDAGNTMDVTYNGVLLRKIQNFEAKDYLQCIKELAAIMKDIHEPAK
jgi:hypothetical protein